MASVERCLPLALKASRVYYVSDITYLTSPSKVQKSVLFANRSLLKRLEFEDNCYFQPDEYTINSKRPP
jgi:hypothetical protein